MDASRHGRALEQDARVARVEFACYAPLGFGEEVVVCGDAPVLGNGDVGRGVALRTSAATYPVWSANDSSERRLSKKPPNHHAMDLR